MRVKHRTIKEIPESVTELRRTEPPSPKTWIQLPGGTWRRGTVLTVAEAVPVEGGYHICGACLPVEVTP